MHELAEGERNKVNKGAWWGWREMEKQANPAGLTKVGRP
jgi:hypothetical protein